MEQPPKLNSAENRLKKSLSDTNLHSNFTKPESARQNQLFLRGLRPEQLGSSSSSPEQQSPQSNASRGGDLSAASQGNDGVRRSSANDSDLRKGQRGPTREKLDQWHQWLDLRFKLEDRLNLVSPKMLKDFKDLQQAIVNYSHFTDTQWQELNPVVEKYQQAVNAYRDTIRTTVDAELQTPGAMDKQVQNANQDVRTAANLANDTLRQSVLEHEPEPEDLADVHRDLNRLQEGIDRYRYFTPEHRQELNPVVDQYRQVLHNYERVLHNYEQTRGARPYQELAARQQVLDANQQVRTVANQGWEVMLQARDANDPGDLRIVYDDFRDFIAELTAAVRDTGRLVGFGGVRVLLQIANAADAFNNAFANNADQEHEVPSLFNRIEPK